MWLRSEKRERHLLTTTISSSRSNRTTIKRTSACPNGQRTNSKVSNSWKQAIKRDVVRNNLKNLTGMESGLPIQSGKNISTSKVLQQVLKRDITRSELKKKCENMQVDKAATLSKTTKTFCSLNVTKTITNQNKTIITRESTRQANKDKLLPLHGKTFVNKNKTRKKTDLDKKSKPSDESVDQKTTNKVDLKLPKSTGDNIVANCVRNGKSVNGLSTPRKSTRLEKSEKLSVVNNSPSRKARQMPRRPINHQIISMNSCLTTKCHKSINKPTTNAQSLTLKDKSVVEVPSAFNNDWSTIAEQEMLMYEKESKFNENEALNEESDNEERSDHNLAAVQSCLNEESLNTFVSISDVQNLIQNEANNRSYGRCSSLDRKIVTDKNKNVNLRDKRSSSLRKEYSEPKTVKRRSSAIEFHRTNSTKNDVNLRRISCDKMSVTKSWKKNEKSQQMDVEINIDKSNNKTYSRLHTKNHNFNMQSNRECADNFTQQDCDKILQTADVKELRAIINCEEALHSFDQPDFISIFNDPIESGAIDEESELCKTLEQKSWQNSTFSEDEELAFSDIKTDSMQLSTRSAIERLEALSDLQLQPTSFLADISQSLAATEDGWINVA